MPIIATTIESDEQWLNLRRDFVGASEVAALLGCHPFLSGYGLWANKTGRIPTDSTDSAAMRRGREDEKIAISRLREDMPHWRFDETRCYYGDPEIQLGATPDLVVDNEHGRGVIEIKSVEPSVFSRTWFDADGTLRAPLHVAIQATTQAYLVDAQWAAACAVVTSYGRDIHLADIPIVPGVIDRIRNEVAAFWRMVKENRSPEPDYGRDAALIAAILRQDDGTELDLTGDNSISELVEQRVDAAKLRDAAEANFKSLNAELLHRIGNAQRVKFNGGTLTAKTINSKEYTVGPRSYRQIRVRMNKESVA